MLYQHSNHGNSNNSNTNIIMSFFKIKNLSAYAEDVNIGS